MVKLLFFHYYFVVDVEGWQNDPERIWIWPLKEPTTYYHCYLESVFTRYPNGPEKNQEKMDFFDVMELILKSGPVHVMELVMELKKVMYLVKIPG